MCHVEALAIPTVWILCLQYQVSSGHLPKSGLDIRCRARISLHAIASSTLCCGCRVLGFRCARNITNAMACFMHYRLGFSPTANGSGCECGCGRGWDMDVDVDGQ